MQASLLENHTFLSGYNVRDNKNAAQIKGNQTQERANRYNFAIDAHQSDDRAWHEIESFIKRGFQNAYGAEISITMPTLIAVKSGTYKAALGIREASHPLFVEQYLNQSIELNLLEKGVIAHRENIVEIGHLFSNKAKFALPLLLTAGVSLFMNQYRHIAFCATTQVRKLIQDAGIALIDIGAAEKEKLTSSNDNWGTYYDTQPRVVAISTLDIIQAIADRPNYQEMFETLFARIQCVSGKLAGWKQ